MKYYGIYWRDGCGHYGLEEVWNSLEVVEDRCYELNENEEDCEVYYEFEEVSYEVVMKENNGIING